MRKKYFGRYPLLNMLVSKLIFVALAYRKRALQRRAKKMRQQYKELKTINDESCVKDLRILMDKGYDKLNLGGGVKNLEGFINIDFIDRPGVRNKVVANLHDLSFIPDSSISHIHSNHVIEHFTRKQLSEQMRQYHRILKEQGLITLRCPNALGVCFGFFFGAVKEPDRDVFLALGYPADEEFSNPDDNWYYKDLWGLFHWLWAYPDNPENSHLVQITPSLLINMLKENGFEILKTTPPETSNIIVVAKKMQQSGQKG